jgi:hypothetical protein
MLEHDCAELYNVGQSVVIFPTHAGGFFLTFARKPTGSVGSADVEELDGEVEVVPYTPSKEPQVKLTVHR